jgi:hypothetical protein
LKTFTTEDTESTERRIEREKKKGEERRGRENEKERRE